MEVGEPGAPSSLASGQKKRRESSSLRPSSEEEQVMTKKRRTMRDRLEKIFARREDHKTVVARKARVLAVFALLSPIRGNKRKEFMNRVFIDAISIRRFVVLKPRSAELRLSNFEGQPPRLEMCLDNLKPIAGGPSKNVGRRLRVGIHVTPHGHLEILLVH
jgi:hypothetical protein